MRIQKPVPTELNDVEDMRWAFVGVAFMVGLAWVTVPMALSGYASLQAANGDGSPALLVAWLVYWLLAIFPAVFAIGSLFGVLKLLTMLDAEHFPSIPVQLAISAALLYGAHLLVR